METGFPSTHWTDIATAGRGTEEDQAEALNRFARRYREPMHLHLQVRFHANRWDAEDAVHGFFVDQVIKKQFLAKAIPFRGRLRNFLRKALDNYYRNVLRKIRSQKCIAAGGALSLEEWSGFEVEAPEAGFSITFDQAWAVEMLTETTRRMERECVLSGKQHLWEILACRIIRPLLENCPVLDYEAFVQQFGFPSPKKAGDALHNAKEKFLRILRALVAEYAEESAAVEQEIRELKHILSSPSAWSSLPSPSESETSLRALPERWGKVLLAVAERSRHWEKSELKALWLHTLSTPITLDEWGATTSANLGIHEVTIRDLFFQPNPPVELLNRLKHWAKACRNRPECGLPPEIGSALYFGAVATAHLRRRSRITKLNNDEIRTGIEWSLKQEWIDERMKDLFRTALLSHHEGGIDGHFSI
jgi:hypothetical protein